MGYIYIALGFMTWLGLSIAAAAPCIVSSRISLDEEYGYGAPEGADPVRILQSK